MSKQDDRGRRKDSWRPIPAGPISDAPLSVPHTSERSAMRCGDGLVERVFSLTDIAVAFPSEKGPRKYVLENKSDRDDVGYALAECSVDEKFAYRLSVFLGRQEVYTGLSEWSTPNRMRILGAGGEIGDLVSSDRDLADSKKGTRWVICREHEEWGEVIRSGFCVGERLWINLRSGCQVPLSLQRTPSFFDFVRASLTVVSLGFVGPSANNADLLVPEATVPQVNTSDVELIFISALIFRMIVFPRDFSYVS